MKIEFLSAEQEVVLSKFKVGQCYRLAGSVYMITDKKWGDDPSTLTAVCLNDGITVKLFPGDTRKLFHCKVVEVEPV